MNINEIILNERLGATGAKDQPSVFKDIGDFAGRVGSDIVGTGKMLGNVASDVGTKVASGAEKVYNNPKQVARDVGDTIKAGAKYAYNNPGEVARTIGQTADDAVRATANAATFGLADKLSAGIDSARKGTKYDDEVQAQDAATLAAWERSPNASMAGTVAGAVVDPGFYLGAKLAGKGLSKALPVATTKTGKIATGATNLAGQTAAGFAGSRAGWDASDTLQGKPVKENDELADIQRLSGQRIDEFGFLKGMLKGAPKAPPKAPHVSAPQNTGIAGLDPGVKKAQTQAAEPNNASYQDRVRAAQQKKSAAQASGPVDPNVNPQTAAMQKQIDALAKQQSNIPKQKSMVRKAVDWTGKKALQTTGVGLAGLAGYDYFFHNDPANYRDYLDKKKKEREDAEQKEREEEEANASNNSSDQSDSTTTPIKPINTTNDDNPFDALKTNEGIDELSRVKHLISYRK
jgi:hypothetical protein